MFVKIDRLQFLKKLRIVEKAISENKVKPIIGCVFIKAQDNKMTFYGTNLEITMISSIEANVIENGIVAFHPELIEEYIKELSDTELSLKVQNGNLIIETEDSATEFSIMNADEYPKLDYSYDGAEKWFTIQGTELLETFEKVKFSAATGSENLAINCIRLEVSDKIARFVTTDTYRMTYLEKPIENQCELEISIPLNSVEAITKLLRVESLEDIKVMYKKNYVYFISGETEIISRIIELSYPNYKGILQGAIYNKKFVIKNSDFCKILKRVQIFVKNNTDTKNGALLEFKNGRLLINGTSSIAKVVEDFPINYEGDNLKISLNVKFLLEFMQNLDNEKDIIIELKEANSSVKIVEEGKEDYIYVVMPLALKS
ncbi:DNA polymerase III subunit beta [Fusobacterium perfoetens]|uniref:DNA polymerase III subunit beta n=1 Tax=Fusobacterium perfoetens TaxID=852 RepID=UPI000486E6EB|nr:DNA polymerase III subunit beta [Fusobacterium perfoetens]MCI6152392.1 DNA polymerase III subunit beta [Fusobacterium perfoetens]MDY3236991.1 DNA polymerase III subunit beta [Fusobacterium perfoetens]